MDEDNVEKSYSDVNGEKVSSEFDIGRKKTSRIRTIVILILSLFLLIGIVCGLRYLQISEQFNFFKQMLGNMGVENKSLDENIKVDNKGSEEDKIETRRYFDGLKYIEERGEETKLLVVEGSVRQIDVEKKEVLLELKGEEMAVEFVRGDKAFLVKDDDPIFREEMDFNGIRIGDFVSYNPTKIGKVGAVWYVLRQN